MEGGPGGRQVAQSQIVVPIEAGEAAGTTLGRRARDAEKRPHEARAIHVVQRKAIRRDHAAIASPISASPAIAIRSSGSDAPTGCGSSWKRFRSWILIRRTRSASATTATSSRTAAGALHRERDRADLVPARRPERPADRDPVRRGSGEERQRRRSRPAAERREREGRHTPIERQRQQNRASAREQPRRAGDQDPRGRARPPLAILVGHVAAREPHECAELQEEQRQRNGKIDDRELLRIVRRLSGKEAVRRRGQQTTRRAGRSGRGPRPGPPPPIAQRRADDPRQHHGGRRR